MTIHITTTVTGNKNNNLCVYKEKHKAQSLLWNWWKNNNFTIERSRQLFFLAKLVLSLVYRSISSIHFFLLLKNGENDMGLGKNGTKLWLVKLQCGNIRERERERERERALTYSVLAENTKNGTKSPFFMIRFSLPLSISSHLRKEKPTHTQLHT